MTKLQTNQFDLSHDVKLSLDMGKLVPIMVLECIPGDRHKISCESLLRFAPLTAPVMHRYDVTMHYFFVPNRILWPNWENFITNTKLDSTGELPAHPYIDIQASMQSYDIGTLLDYMGIPYNLNPTQYTQDIKINALPFAAYQCIYNEYYRDQNLIAPVDYKLTDGANNARELQRLRTRAWEHDYFTACLPFAQKGDAVDIPLGNIVLSPNLDPNPLTGNPQFIQDANGNFLSGDVLQDSQYGLNVSGQGPAWLNPNGSLQTEPTTINDLRRAFKLQEWLEKAARGGSRYIEWIKVMFGVNSSDKRLQRPEYITGTKSPVVISEVLNTTGVDGELPQGNMAGHAVSVTSAYGDSYYCEEHGFIIGIMSVMPKPAYFQGLDRMWSKIEDPTQYFFSSFANIGEQEVLNKEIFAYGGDQDGTFGYIPRYAEYRYQPNRVCGDFRTSLRFWHQARLFATPQNLNQQFIECTPDKRIFAVEDYTVQSLYCQVYNKVMSTRPLPKYGTPTF